MRSVPLSAPMASYINICVCLFSIYFWVSGPCLCCLGCFVSLLVFICMFFSIGPLDPLGALSGAFLICAHYPFGCLFCLIYACCLFVYEVNHVDHSRLVRPRWAPQTRAPSGSEPGDQRNGRPTRVPRVLGDPKGSKRPKGPRGFQGFKCPKGSQWFRARRVTRGPKAWMETGVPLNGFGAAQ